MNGCKVKVSNTDTSGNFLMNKLVAGSNITLTRLNAGANETYSIAASGGGGGGARQLLCPDIFADNNILGDGLGTTLAGAGYNLAAAQAAFPLAAAVLTGDPDLLRTIDFIASYCAIEAQKAGGNQSEVHWGLLNETIPGGNFDYVMGDSTFDNLPTGQGWFGFYGHGCIIESLDTLFQSIPPDQSTADVWVLRHFTFKDFTFSNNTATVGDGSTCFYFGALTNSVWENIVVSGYDVQWDLAYCLSGNFLNIGSITPFRKGIKLTTGADRDSSFAWSSASLSNSASNANYFRNIVCYGQYNMTSQMEIWDSSDNEIHCLVLQGPSAPPSDGDTYCENGALYSNDATVSKGIRIEGVHVEWGYNTAVFNHIDREGRMFVHYLFNQTQGLDAVINRVVLKSTHTSGKSGFVCHQGYDSAPANMQFQCDDGNWNYFDFDCPYIAGNPQTVTDLQATSLWADANIPVVGNLRIKPPLL